MEDILASIRRIIADDQSRQSAAAAARPAMRPNGAASPGGSSLLPDGVAARQPLPSPPTAPSQPPDAAKPASPASTAAEPATRTAPPVRPAEAGPARRPLASSLPARTTSLLTNGTAPHLNPPPIDRGVFDEIASVGAASAARFNGWSPSSPPGPAAPPSADAAAPAVEVFKEMTPASSAAPAPASPTIEASVEAPVSPAVDILAPERMADLRLEPAMPQAFAVQSEVSVVESAEAKPLWADVPDLSFPAEAIETPAAPTPAVEPPPAEPLVSAEAGASIEHAFQALVTSVFVQHAGQFDGVVRDLLRPMLKGWLDDNLPAIVERLVRAEIERVARGGRT